MSLNLKNLFVYVSIFTLHSVIIHSILPLLAGEKSWLLYWLQHYNLFSKTPPKYYPLISHALHSMVSLRAPVIQVVTINAALKKIFILGGS